MAHLTRTGNRFTPSRGSSLSSSSTIPSLLPVILAQNCAAISCASTHPYLTRPQWHLALYGRRGQIWLDSIADHLRFVRANGEVVTFDAADASGVYDPGAPTKALTDCDRGALAPAGINASLAARVVAVTDAVYQSARSGGRVRISTQ